MTRLLLASLLTVVTLALLGACDNPTVYVGRRDEGERDRAGDDGDVLPEAPSGDADLGEPAPPPDDAGVPDEDPAREQDAGPSVEVADAGRDAPTDGGAQDDDFHPPIGDAGRFQTPTRCYSDLGCARQPWPAFCSPLRGICVPRCTDPRGCGRPPPSSGGGQP